MAAVLVVGVLSGDALHPATAEVVTLARELGAALDRPVVGALLGTPDTQSIERMARTGISKLYTFSGPGAGEATADVQASAIAEAVVACGATIVLAPHTLDTAEWMPFAAGRARAVIVTDCKNVTVVAGRLHATKMICGGAVGADYVIDRPLTFITVTPGVFSQAVSDEACKVSTCELPPAMSSLRVVAEVGAPNDGGPPLKQASVVVSGGMGVGGREHWSLVTDTANALGAAVGATRAVVESGWAAASCQVGYSGAKVAPDLYVAIGISGAVHHLVGIAQAKNVVAINTDPTAEIFKVSRFGVIGDAKTVVPAFLARLRELQNS